MDKIQAIHNFWSGFNLPAYDENSVPTGENAPDFPYITYFTATDALGYPVQLNGSLWYRDSSWKDISLKAQEISNAIGLSGNCIKIDDGYMWLIRGNPFSQRMSEPNDDMVRRIYLNIQVEFLTAN